MIEIIPYRKMFDVRNEESHEEDNLNLTMYIEIICWGQFNATVLWVKQTCEFVRINPLQLKYYPQI